jgi:hypothetical protein
MKIKKNVFSNLVFSIILPIQIEFLGIENPKDLKIYSPYCVAACTVGG